MKIKLHLGTGFAGVSHDDVLDISDGELEGMSDKEVIDYIESEAKDWAWNHLDLNWDIVDEGVTTDE